MHDMLLGTHVVYRLRRGVVANDTRAPTASIASTSTKLDKVAKRLESREPEGSAPGHSPRPD